MNNKVETKFENEIQELKDREKELLEPGKTGRIISREEDSSGRRQKRAKRQAPSLFGPMILIALGLYFLLSNLNIIDGQLHWAAVFSLWPLFLIFAGINIIARQVPGVVGSMLSGLVGIVAVAAFGGILLFADQVPVLGNLANVGGSEIVQSSVSHPAAEINRGRVIIDGTYFPLSIDSDLPAGEFISADIAHAGTLIDNFSVSGGEATYELGMRSTGWSFPTSNGNRWDIHLTDDIPLDLTLDLGSGSSDNNLSSMELTHLEIDAGSGFSSTNLPDGSYEIKADMGSGASRFILPATGEIEMLVDGGSGSVRLVLPSSMDARIVVDGGSGAFSPNGRFELVSGERWGDGIWETEGYDPDDSNRIDLTIDIGSGQVTIGNE